MATGAWDQALTDFAWARETSRQIAAARPLLGALTGLGGLLLARGEWEAAAVHLDEAVALAARHHERSSLRAASLLLAERDLLAGQPKAACARLLPLRALSDPQERYIDDLPVWLAWAKAEVGALDEAGTLILAAIACIRADNRRFVLVDALRVQALVALKQARWTEAERTLAVARAIGYPYAEARLLYVQGRAHLQQGRPEEANIPFQAALAIFGRLGARVEAALVEQALSGLQPASAREAPSLTASGWPKARRGRRPAEVADGRLARPARQAWALQRLRTAGALSPSAYARALGVSADTALLDLRDLVARGLVCATGATRDRRYVLADEGRL